MRTSVELSLIQLFKLAQILAESVCLSVCVCISGHLSSNIVGMRRQWTDTEVVLLQLFSFLFCPQTLVFGAKWPTDAAVWLMPQLPHAWLSLFIGNRTTHSSRCTGAVAIMTLFADIYHLCYHIQSQDTILLIHSVDVALALVLPIIMFAAKVITVKCESAKSVSM